MKDLKTEAEAYAKRKMQQYPLPIQPKWGDIVCTMIELAFMDGAVFGADETSDHLERMITASASGTKQ